MVEALATDCPSHLADKWMIYLLEACDAVMPTARVTDGGNRTRDTYWWTGELVQYRDAAALAKKKLHKAYKRRVARPAEIENRRREYRSAKRDLRYRMTRAKIAAWESFCQEINNNSWGKPYRVV